MGGTVIKTRAQIILEQGLEKGLEKGLEQGREQGLEQGREEGEAKGEVKTLAGLVQKGIITLKQAAEQGSLSVDAFVEQCRKYNLSI